MCSTKALASLAKKYSAEEEEEDPLVMTSSAGDVTWPLEWDTPLNTPLEWNDFVTWIFRIFGVKKSLDSCMLQ